MALAIQPYIAFRDGLAVFSADNLIHRLLLPPACPALNLVFFAGF
jgi:hypothetical protein